MNDDHIARFRKIVGLDLGHLVGALTSGFHGIARLDDIMDRERAPHEPAARNGGPQGGGRDATGNSEFIKSVGDRARGVAKRPETLKNAIRQWRKTHRVNSGRVDFAGQLLGHFLPFME